MDQDPTDLQFNASVARMLHREALRRAALETNTTSAAGLEGMLASISAEATAEAAARFACRVATAPDSGVSVADAADKGSGESAHARRLDDRGVCVGRIAKPERIASSDAASADSVIKRNPFMSQTPDSEENAPDPDASDRSKAMDDRLRSDVTSWMAARSETPTRHSAEPATPVARPPVAKQPVRAKQVKPAAAAAPLVAEKKKPFGMSYDGMSQADYITYMISRGAR